MNVGVIGFGKMGMLHTGILSIINGVNVVAVAEKDDTLRGYLKNILDKNIYDDYYKMINKEDLDLVYITTPVSLHAKIANDCIERNINFFVEKPLASNLEECNMLYSKLNNKLVNTVGYSKRFTDTFSKAKELIHKGALGELVYVKGSMYLTQVFSYAKGWRFKKSESGGGVLLELASHLVDGLLWYFGKIEEVAATAKSYYSNEVEDFVHAILRFENGLIGYLDASWSIRNYRLPEMTIEVHGSNGTMLVNDDYIRLSLDDEFKKDNLILDAGLSILYKQDLYKGVIIDIGGPEYTREDIYTVECVKKQKQNMLDILEASRVQSVIDAIYSSIKDRTWKRVQYIG